MSILSATVGQIKKLCEQKPKRRKFDDVIDEALALFKKHRRLTFHEYADLIGLDHSAAHTRFKKMHAEGVIHIADYIRQRSGPATPVFAAGAGVDAERPAAFTNAEKRDRYIERLKGDEAGWKKYLAAKRKWHKKKCATDPNYAEKARAWSANYMRRKHGHKPRMPNVKAIDPLLAAIMGVKK